MRNINIPRSLGIPNPMAYQQLCRCLSDNWDKLQEHFARQTEQQAHKVSRIHIRSLQNSKALFSMNYKNFNIDDSPEPDLLIGSRYLVKTDISNCFPSIYTHCIPWALAGKTTAKNNKHNEWYDEIDMCARNCKNGETHGLLIGPHVSNLLAEIILTVIDQHMYADGWKYIRKIDDYSCYVSSYEQGQRFLVKLGEELRHFDLLLNYKKTEILTLPLASVEQWVREINSINIVTKEKRVKFTGARSFLDSVIGLMYKNNENSSILFYAIKILVSQNLTENARLYTIKTITHLALLFPYLLPILDKELFEKLQVDKEWISSNSQKFYSDNLQLQNYEGVCYAIYFALKYNFRLADIDIESVLSSNSCIFKLMAYLYYNKIGDSKCLNELKKHARSLSENEDDFNENWLFVYEVLSKSNLKGEWKHMKEQNISFITLA